MADPSRSPGTGDDDGTGYDREPPPGVPRWVKVIAIVIAIVALLVVVMMLVGGGGQHNPLRHVAEGGGTPPVSVTAR